jgi:CubicO group peptidase (beta-lactamase class C family)
MTSTTRLMCALLFVLCLTRVCSGQTLEETLDQTLRKNMKEYSVPGAVLVVVREGKVTLARGYGLSDVRLSTPVSADQTLFRAGSISKILTAMAVLTLVKEGQLRLDTDIRAGLPSDVAQRIDRAVNLKQLLTHTSGIDNSDIGDAARSLPDLKSLQKQLAEALPPQVCPPGALFHYSNYNYALAGLLIEHSMGVSFADAMDDLVLEPYGLLHSTFHQPARDALRGAVARGYEESKGGYKELPFDFSQVAPADSLLTTGADMGRLLELLLEKSRSSSGVVDAMLRRQFGVHPQLDGIAFPFFEDNSRTVRVLTYTGGQLGFTSQIALAPEKDIAFFVSYNRRVSTPRRNLFDAFLETVGPPVPRASKGAATSGGPPAAHEGTYRYTDSPESTPEKTWHLFGLLPELSVRAVASGLIVDGNVFAETSPGLFCGEGVCGVFVQSGGQSYAVTGLESYRKLHWYENTNAHRVVLILCLIVFCTALFRRAHRWNISPQTGAPHAIRFLRCAALCLLLFGVMFSVMAKTSGGDWDYGLPLSVSALLLLPPVAAVATVAAVLLLPAVLRRQQGRFTRLHSAATAVACVLFLILLHYWNLLQLPR